MLRAIKVRLYPDNEQQLLLNKVMGCYRFTYNKCLEHIQEVYKETGKHEKITDTQKWFHSFLIKTPEYEFLKEFNSNILKVAIQNINTAYLRFFDKTSSYPKFKSKNKSNNSVKFYKGTCISIHNLDDNLLSLTKNLKGIKFRSSDNYTKFLIENRKNIQNITITKQKSGIYEASILFKLESDYCSIDKILPEPKNYSIGIDLGISKLLTDSKGNYIENFHFYKSIEKRIKYLHRQLSKKKFKSKNREKARIRLAMAYRYMVNMKNDFLHNLSHKLINDNQVIILEDLKITNMVRNHKLAKSILEMGWGEFRRQLDYKAIRYGRNIIYIDTFFPSSKTCSCCGHVKESLKLSDRIFVCESCGSVMDRDHNAGINIEVEGLRILEEMNGGSGYPQKVCKI